MALALDSLVVAIITTGIRKKDKSVFMNVELECESGCVVDVPKLACAQVSLYNVPYFQQTDLVLN